MYTAYSVDYLGIFNQLKEVRENGRLTTDKAIPLEDSMRIQPVSIINNYQFDSVVLGTSILKNTSSQTCNTNIGGTFINISMSGSTFYERSFVLNYLLNNIDIKNVIYSLDLYYLDCLKYEDENYTIEDWGFVYGQTIIENIRKIFFYMNKKSMNTILGYRNSVEMKTPDSPGAWMTFPNIMCRFGGLDNWVKNQDIHLKKFFKELPNIAKLALQYNKYRPITNQRQLKKTIEYIDSNILKYVKNNKKTKFYFVFPPYWRIVYAKWRQATPSLFALHQDVIRYVVLQAQALGNVEIYGFEDCNFVDDIKNYIDTIHYHSRINDYMIRSIGSGTHRLTPDNVEAYLLRCERLASTFDLQAFAADVKERLESFHNQKNSMGLE